MIDIKGKKERKKEQNRKEKKREGKEKEMLGLILKTSSATKYSKKEL